MLPLKLICRANRIHADGTASIFIQYCYSATQRTLLHTYVRIPPAHWNKKLRCISNTLPESFGNSILINERLTKSLRIAEDLVTYAIKSDIKEKGNFVKQKYDLIIEDETQHSNFSITEITNIVDKKDEASVYYQFDEYVKTKNRKVGKATLTVYKNVKSHLQAFENFRRQKITFESFDFNFYEDFVDYLTFDHIHLRRKTPITGVKLNTVGKTIKHLRGFIKDRMRRKIIKPIDLTDFKIPEEECDAIYLSHQEIISLYQTDLTSNPELIEFRDLFVLACLTGLRFSDFSTLKPEDLRKDMLYKKQEKSDHWVIIPLRTEAKEIFTKQFKERIPKLSNPEFNRQIKIIGKLANLTRSIKFSHKKGSKSITVTKPKYDWITSHTARRSFCTNEFLAGTPVELIMKISGHKRTKDFYKYIRISPEEAANKIKELWLARNDMKLVNEN